MTSVTLIYPRTQHESNYKTFWAPYSILSVGSALNEMGCDVKLFDNNLLKETPENIVKKIPETCQIVGISSMIGHQIREAIEIANLIKYMRPNTKITIGGTMPSMMPDVVLEETLFDIAVRGQGEKTIIEIIDFLNNKRELNEISGISYRNLENVVHNPDRKIEQRANLPRFNFSLLDFNKYIQRDKKISSRTVNYISSQGCPFDCGFCSDTNLFSKRYSKNTTEMTIADIEHLINNYNVNGIKFYDSNFFVDTKCVKKFAEEIINKNLQIKWAGAIHPATFRDLDNDYLNLIRASGCSRLLIGAESGSQEVLDLVGKSLSPFEMLYIAKRSAKFGFSVSFTMIVGFPEVAEKHYYETFNLGEKLIESSPLHEVKMHIYAPYPMTRLYSKAIKCGFVPPKNLLEWVNYDYYYSQTPWVPKHFEEMVRKFNFRYSSAIERI